MTVVMLDENRYIRAINLSLTIPLIGALIYRNILNFKLDKEKGYIPSSMRFRKTKYLKLVIAEVIIHALISPPQFENKLCYWVLARKVCNPLSDLFMLFTVLRLYLIVRAICYFTKWTSGKSEEIDYICRDLYGVDVNASFAFKCLFKKRPFVFLITFILTIAIVASFCIRIFERAYYNSDPIIDSSSSDF